MGVFSKKNCCYGNLLCHENVTTCSPMVRQYFGTMIVATNPNTVSKIPLILILKPFSLDLPFSHLLLAISNSCYFEQFSVPPASSKQRGLTVFLIICNIQLYMQQKLQPITYNSLLNHVTEKGFREHTLHQPLKSGWSIIYKAQNTYIQEAINFPLFIPYM